MPKTTEDTVADLEKRLNRIENVLWVLGSVALFLGIGGGSLWGKLQAASDRADAVERVLAEVSVRIDRDVKASVDLGKKEIEASAASVQGEITALQSADPGWSVAYCTHQESLGWHSWVTDGTESGRPGISKRLEAVRIVLYRKNEKPPTGQCTP